MDLECEQLGILILMPFCSRISILLKPVDVNYFHCRFDADSINSMSLSLAVCFLRGHSRGEAGLKNKYNLFAHKLALIMRNGQGQN